MGWPHDVALVLLDAAAPDQASQPPESLTMLLAVARMIGDVRRDDPIAREMASDGAIRTLVEEVAYSTDDSLDFLRSSVLHLCHAHRQLRKISRTFAGVDFLKLQQPLPMASD
jgi:hypothetical protein